MIIRLKCEGTMYLCEKSANTTRRRKRGRRHRRRAGVTGGEADAQRRHREGGRVPEQVAANPSNCEPVTVERTLVFAARYADDAQRLRRHLRAHPAANDHLAKNPCGSARTTYQHLDCSFTRGRWGTVRGTVPRWNCASIPDAAGPVAPVARSGESPATSQFGPDWTGTCSPDNAGDLVGE